MLMLMLGVWAAMAMVAGEHVVRMWPAYETHATSRDRDDYGDGAEAYEDRMKRLQKLRHITSMTQRPTAMTLTTKLGERKLTADERNWAGDQRSLSMVTTAETKVEVQI